MTVAELNGRGVAFIDAIHDVGHGLATHVRMPGKFDVELDQPRHSKGPA